MDKEENATGDGDHEEASGYAPERKRKALVDSRPEGSAKKARQEDLTGASMEEIMEAMNYGMQRQLRKGKKRGRRKESTKKLTPETNRMLGEANLHYAFGRFEEAVPILSEVVKKAPDLPDSYHTLGIIHDNFAPRDPTLWELLFDRFNKRGNSHYAIYCLSRAISADPKNMNLKFDRALLYVKLGDYQKAAASYEQIVQACTDNVEALKTRAIMYERCGQQERSIQILEDYLINHPTEADLSVVNLLASILMENNSHKEAL
ncbi:hypothetical protein ACFX1Z_024386 [Malus domestica]